MSEWKFGAGGTMFREENAYELTSDIISKTGVATPREAITRALSGYDHRNAGSPWPRDTTHHGFTFVTRPLLNLSYNNVLGSDILSKVVDGGTKYEYLRALLDPLANEGNGWECEFFDNNQPFIPLLTNTIQSASGFPDRMLMSWESPEGKRKETYGYVDAPAEVNNKIPLTLSFFNMEGNFLQDLFEIWITYAGLSPVNEVHPDGRFLDRNSPDYMTRIFRVTMDRTMTHIVDIGSCTAGWPMNDNIGKRLNFDKTEPFLSGTDTFDVQMEMWGYDANTSYVKERFNDVVNWYCGHPEASGYRRVSRGELMQLNNVPAIPYIDLMTSELIWYIKESF